MGHALGNNYGKFYSFQSKPVILDLQFEVLSTAGNGTALVKGQGVKQVYMHSSAPAAGNPNPAVGIAQINLAYNYARAYCLDYSFVSPVTGSPLAINGTALTVGAPYQIVSVGAGPTGAETIVPVADVSGSLASTWFRLYDAYGNTFIVWFSVSGVGSAPVGVSGTLVQVSIASGATAAQVGAQLVTVLGNLPSGVSGVLSFTASGTTTVTLTSTNAGLPLPGVAADGLIPTGFSFALTRYGTNLNAFQKVGLPQGLIPTVGQSFIASSTGYATGGGSSGTVQAFGSSGIGTIEILGDMNYSVNPIPQGGSSNPGGYFLIQFLAPTSSSVTTPIPTAPVDTTIVKMKVLLEQAARVGGNAE